MDKSYFEISEEIRIALKDKKPVVALESTLISHGLPYPINLEVAKSSMNAVRSSGSIPATIAIINGKIKVGLNNDDLNILSQNNNIEKVERVLKEIEDYIKLENSQVAGILVEPIQDQVFNAVQEIAEARQYDFVLDKSSDLVMLYANKRHDISDQILLSIKRSAKRTQVNSRADKEELKRDEALTLDQVNEREEREAEAQAQQSERERIIADRKATRDSIQAARKAEYEARRQKLLEDRQRRRDSILEARKKVKDSIN